jgi:hypothetical protein
VYFLSTKNTLFFVAGSSQLATAYSGPGTVATRNKSWDYILQRPAQIH